MRVGRSKLRAFNGNQLVVHFALNWKQKCAAKERTFWCAENNLWLPFGGSQRAAREWRHTVDVRVAVAGAQMQRPAGRRRRARESGNFVTALVSCAATCGAARVRERASGNKWPRNASQRPPTLRAGAKKRSTGHRIELEPRRRRSRMSSARHFLLSRSRRHRTPTASGSVQLGSQQIAAMSIARRALVAPAHCCN